MRFDQFTVASGRGQGLVRPLSMAGMLLLALLAIGCETDAVEGGEVHVEESASSVDVWDAGAADFDPGMDDSDGSLQPDDAVYDSLEGATLQAVNAVYHPGVRTPSHRSGARLNEELVSFYQGWKRRYLVNGCRSGERRIKSSPVTDPYTVSEGHGFGMLIVVAMAPFDRQARSIFDGLLKYKLAHPSGENGALMAWAQNQQCRDVEGDASATDGDFDIAYALLLAHKRWGSRGKYDYEAEAIRMIDALAKSTLHPKHHILLGDWARYSDTHYGGTRLSDFMPSHMRSFYEATGDKRWRDALSRSYEIVDSLQRRHAPKTGLLPDFAVKATQAPKPAPSHWLEAEHDGQFSWNANRTPWRIAMDYVLDGDKRAQKAVRRMNGWIRRSTKERPSQIRAGYRLNGRPLASYPAIAFTAPMMVAAMVNPTHGTNQSWLNDLWSEVVKMRPSEYYGDSIKVLCMLAASGNWRAP